MQSPNQYSQVMAVCDSLVTFQTLRNERFGVLAVNPDFLFHLIDGLNIPEEKKIKSLP